MQPGKTPCVRFVCCLTAPYGAVASLLGAAAAALQQIQLRSHAHVRQSALCAQQRNNTQSTDREHQGTGTHAERESGGLASAERRKVPVLTHFDLLPVLALPLEFPNTQNEKAQNNRRGVPRMSSWREPDSKGHCGRLSAHAVGHATRATSVRRVNGTAIVQ